MARKSRVEIMPPSNTTNTGNYQTHYHYYTPAPEMRRSERIIIGLFVVSLLLQVVMIWGK